MKNACHPAFRCAKKTVDSTIEMLELTVHEQVALD